VVRDDAKLMKYSLKSTKHSGFETEPATNSKKKLESSFYSLQRKIRNLKQSLYLYKKSSIKNLDDSLKPIEFLREKDSEIIKTSIF
jgi:hypothetical protein